MANDLASRIRRGGIRLSGSGLSVAGLRGSRISRSILGILVAPLPTPSAAIHASHLAHLKCEFI